MSKKPKKAKSLYTFLKPKLRRASQWWSGKKEARDAARVDIQDGFYKNGNPRFRKKYICAECERQGIEVVHDELSTQMDHINPVVDVKSEEFDGDWTKFITSLFCSPEGYQCLCIAHHEEKTATENLQRPAFNKKKSIRKAKNPSKINTFQKLTPAKNNSKKRRKKT